MKNSFANIFREHLKVKSFCLHLSSPNANLNRIRRNLINKLQYWHFYTPTLLIFTFKINPILISKESHLYIIFSAIIWREFFFLNLLNQTDICRKIISISFINNPFFYYTIYLSNKKKKKKETILLYYKIRVRSIIFFRIKDRSDYLTRFLRTKLKDVNQQCSRRFFDAYVGVENICKCVSTCVVVKAVTPSWKHNLARSKTHLSPFWISLRPIIAHVTIFIILSVKQDGPSFSISLLSYAVLSRDNPLERGGRGARFFKKKKK